MLLWTINQHTRLSVPGIARSEGFSCRSHIDHFIQRRTFGASLLEQL